MKRLSLQWRITLLTVLLIGAACVSMKLLLCASGLHYMDSIGSFIQDYGSAAVEGDPAFFDPELAGMNEDVTIVIHGAQDVLLHNQLVHHGGGDGAQRRFWPISSAARALKPLRSFASQVEKVQLNNLADMKIDEDVLPEFRQFSRSFNQMLERLNNAFAAQRQFTGNAAHELRTPLALMQAQLELFSAEHPDILPETAEFLALLREQTERLTQMTKTLLEMSNLQQVARNEQIQLAPMIEEIFTDLAPLAEKSGITLEAGGRRRYDRKRRADLPAAFQSDGERRQVQPSRWRRCGFPWHRRTETLLIRVSDTGCGIPEEFQQSIFQPFFRVDKSRSREYGGAGLGLSLVWEIADLHGGSVRVEESSERGTVFAVELPAQ